MERFRDNLRGHEFVIHFKKRHPELTERFAGNIKCSRPKINPEINPQGVPPDCIFNYNETGLSDDLG